ncbi:MAG: hypothetical protein JWM19_412 [Actinomycetia bacterium]|nr:hypothetical protein [Actinomycetes bacterium]
MVSAARSRRQARPPRPAPPRLVAARAGEARPAFGTACPRCYILRPIPAQLCDQRTAVGKMSVRRQRRPRRHRSSSYYRIITYITYAAYVSLTSALGARKEATVAASKRAVARAGGASPAARAGSAARASSAARAGHARRIGRVGPARLPGRSSVACRDAPGLHGRVARASGSGWPSARRSDPLGALGRRAGYSGRSVAFGTAGPGRAGWNGAGQGGVNPVDAGVAEVPEIVTSELDKGNINGYSRQLPGKRSHAIDYRYVRAFPTLVT